MLESLMLYLKGMRILMFQLSGFYYNRFESLGCIRIALHNQFYAYACHNEALRQAKAAGLDNMGALLIRTGLEDVSRILPQIYPIAATDSKPRPSDSKNLTMLEAAT